VSTAQDQYEGFAGRYDLFHGEFDRYTAEEAAFFRELSARHQVRTVLDCACGTGRHLHLFHSLGREVVGSDISAPMLAQARKNLASRDLEIPLHRVDYRELPRHFDRKFDVVVCLSSSILHMPDDEQVLRALCSMREVLREGGLLVLSQGTTDRQWKEKPRFILAANTRDFSRLFVIDYLGAGARYNILDIHHSEELDELQTWSIEYPRMLLKDDQEELLRAAGFEMITFYGSYQFEPYDKASSQLLIAVAHNGERIDGHSEEQR
jgi:glycine/sarcosine N-methyltransferase